MNDLRRCSTFIRIAGVDNMEYHKYTINDVDKSAIALILLEQRKSQGDWEDVSPSRVEEVIQQNFEGTEDVFICAESGSELLGVSVIHFDSDKSAQLNPWFLGGVPVVTSNERDDMIHTGLFDHVMEHIRSTNVNRVEIFFTPEKHEGSLITILSKYGFKLVEEIVHLREAISELKLKADKISPDIDVKPLFAIDREELYSTWHNTFLDGEDRSFLDRNEEQRREFFDDLFDESESYVEDATIAIVQDSVIAGFIIIRLTHGENNGHVWLVGINSDYRRKGYAKMLLAQGKKTLTNLGMNTMSVNVDYNNKPAYKLYTSLGFKEEWRQICYGWER